MARHGVAWHGVGVGMGMGMGMAAHNNNNNNLQPGRAGRPSLAVSKHGRRAEGGEREAEGIKECKSSDPQLTWKG